MCYVSTKVSRYAALIVKQTILMKITQLQCMHVMVAKKQCYFVKLLKH